MSDLDKMRAFGHWLSERKAQALSELYQLSTNASQPVDKMRVKGGHIEAFDLVLHAFSELYNGDLNKFLVEYLGYAPETEEESDGST